MDFYYREYTSHAVLDSDCLREAGEVIPEKTAEEKEQGKSTFKAVMRTRAVHLLAFFILVYVGVEVTIGGTCSAELAMHSSKIPMLFIGWIVTFIINVRGGGPSSGYISSGFFGGMCLRYRSVTHGDALRLTCLFLLSGLTAGRVILLWVNKKVISM